MSLVVTDGPSPHERPDPAAVSYWTSPPSRTMGTTDRHRMHDAARIE